MILKFTKVFYDILEAVNEDKKLIISYGGSSSSKSISILQYLYLYALKYKHKRITVGAESVTVLKKTVIPDMIEHVFGDTYEESRFNKTDMIYTFPTGTIMQFVSCDNESRWHGLRSHITYFDEVFYVPQKVFQQASIRTSERVFVSFNPVSEFWITDYFDQHTTSVLHSTYKDNPFLSDTIISALEERISKDDNFRRVYVEGLWGSLEGLIFEEGVNWQITDTMPDTYQNRVIGLDWGYSNDPNAAIDIMFSNGELWVNEILYEKKLINSEIYSKLSDAANIRIVADSAEPKSIEDLKRLGLNIYPSQKGKDSINNGINLIKEFKLNVTRNSINLIKELRNYSWSKDKEGNQLNKPIDNWNHGIDALRYGVYDMLNKRVIKFI